MLEGKRIVLGITGSIAAYKGVEILRELQRRGAEVRVVMTKSATKFVSPLTFATLSRYPVAVEMFHQPPYFEIEHISLSDFAHLILIAPATANIIGKIAGGIADDLLTSTVMAASCPVLIAPAMHSQMWNNPLLQENVRKLKQLGYHFVGPEEGDLASGGRGMGRLASVERIVGKVEEILNPPLTLKGVRILITAGPTREFIDPVRFISNPSTGLMGYKIGEEALKRGADVVIVSGPTHLEPPSGAKVIKVESADEMLSAVLEEFPSSDVVIGCAAVSDFAPIRKEEEKIKKERAKTVLELRRTPDILWELGRRKGNKILVGFSAETENVIENALSKLKEKNLDIIVANSVKGKEFGFGAQNLFASILIRGEEPSPPVLISKEEVAKMLLNAVERLLSIRGEG